MLTDMPSGPLLLMIPMADPQARDAESRPQGVGEKQQPEPREGFGLSSMSRDIARGIFAQFVWALRTRPHKTSRDRSFTGRGPSIHTDSPDVECASSAKRPGDDDAVSAKPQMGSGRSRPETGATDHVTSEDVPRCADVGPLVVGERAVAEVRVVGRLGAGVDQGLAGRTGEIAAHGHLLARVRRAVAVHAE